MKTCTKCGEMKPLDQYSRDAACKDGLRTACKPCAAERRRRYYEANAEREREQKRRYHEANAEKVAERKRRHYEANAERGRERTRRYVRVNPDKVAAKWMRRHAAKLQRTTPWSDRVAIAAFYEMAARVSRCLGVEHHVDHVLPLRGKTVSGLHVPLNLRVVPAVVNLRKGNKV